MSDDSSPRVVVADDLNALRKLASALLKSLGCQVVGEARNGLEAVELFKQYRPDLILLDIEMPEMNGVEALEKIIEADADAAVVMLTGLDDQDVVEKCILIGAKDFLRKDLGPQEMKLRLAEKLANLSG